MSKLAIVMYHYVRDLTFSRYPNIKGLHINQFREQLDFFEKTGAHFVGMDQVLEAMYGDSQLPDRSVMLTFDDGYIDHFTNVFPILNERGIPGFFSMPGKIIAERKLLDVNRIHFVLASTPISVLLPMVFERLDFYRGTQFPIESNQDLYKRLANATRFDDQDTVFIKKLLQVELPEELRNHIANDLFAMCIGVKEESFVGELYLSLDQVRMMQHHGMIWGIHGYDHYWMNRLTRDELICDVSNALDVFDGIVPPNNWTCCYPYGSVSNSVIDVIRSLGATCGMTTEVRYADLASESILLLEPPSRNRKQR